MDRRLPFAVEASTVGDPKRRRKQFETPRKQWDRALLAKERKLLDNYGIKNKKELRRHETWLRNKRKLARDLLALPLNIRVQREEELRGGLSKIGLVKKGGSLDDVLGLKVEELLEKRLQTLVFRKGLANTIKQARQFITHGHVAISGKKVSSPNYLVPVNEANSIGWFKRPVKTEISPKKGKRETEIKKEFEEAMKGAEAFEEALPKEDAVKNAGVVGKEDAIVKVEATVKAGEQQ